MHTLKQYRAKCAAVVAADNGVPIKEVLEAYEYDPQETLAGWWHDCEAGISTGAQWDGYWLRSVWESPPSRSMLERWIKNGNGRHPLAVDWAYYVAMHGPWRGRCNPEAF